jgi:hypothetical protein
MRDGVLRSAVKTPVGASAPISRARVGFDLVPTGAEMACEVDEPFATAAPPWHPSIEAPRVNVQDKPFPDLDCEAAKVCFNAHRAFSSSLTSTERVP